MKGKVEVGDPRTSAQVSSSVDVRPLIGPECSLARHPINRLATIGAGAYVDRGQGLCGVRR